MLARQNSNRTHKLILAALFATAGVFTTLIISCTQQDKREAPVPRQRSSGAGNVQTVAKPQINPADVLAVIETEKGNIEIEFLATEAPETSRNFIKNAKVHYYKREKFHRVEPLLIQAGSRFVTEENIPIENGAQQMSRGVVAMAKEEGATVADASEFFICRDTIIVNSDYTVFGKVTSGMDVVDTIVIDDAIINITIRDKD